MTDAPFLLPPDYQNKEISMFEKGQLVECVDVDGDSHLAAIPPGYRALPGLGGLRRGAVYRIRGIKRLFGVDGVLLEEIRRGMWTDGSGEGPFAADRFRPLPSSQISLINSMLVTEPTKENANVS